MKIYSNNWWVKVSIFNLLIVSFLGLVMRYKIGFELLFIDQKNLQLAHSNFAFFGWISLLLMVLLIKSLHDKNTNLNYSIYNKILISYLILNYCLLVSFAISGYSIYSIFFLVVNVLISILFSLKYLKDTKSLQAFSIKWYRVALFFNLLSTLGSFYLMYMMATKSIEQHTYLASVYWHLHFQYNGWFFFACCGLLIDFLQKKDFNIQPLNSVFLFFSISCIPTYGLSVLWAQIPIWIYIIVIIFTIIQFIGVVKLLITLKKINFIKTLNLNKISRLLLYSAGFAILIKFSLQLGSTIPALNKFAFGFRPIVIAYLHLVLLAFTSVFLLVYLYIDNLLVSNKLLIKGLYLFLFGVFTNELVLAIQGVASIDYHVIPYSNLILFSISVLIFLALVFINIASLKRFK